MDASITIGQVLEIVGIMVALWGGVKVIKEIVHSITEKHDQIQKWEEYDQKIKEIKDEQCILTQSMLATLDGLKQLGCNGKVTEARDKLNEYLNAQAHS